MSLEDIQKKILSDAEEKKTQLLNVAKKHAEEIIQDGKKAAQELQHDQERNAKSIAENLERGLIIDARRKLANEILAKKREYMEVVYAKSKSSFLSSKDYSEIMKNLVLKSVNSKNESIIFGKNESVLNSQWVDDINKTCGGKLTVASETGDFIGGVVLKEGDTFVNITADTLFALLRESTEKSVADLLFKG